ncbi:hypothetical protein L6164_029328 [Bauhinia variegata]|uniref:Uncharacterized protein n=1 Tax=Bauhinia variegata TaxID=167791 RepID=A0ACB9L8W1_BAUVA|nr:hypothetical protein L6164_029328 [Bauhinia variegata]
MDEPLLPKTGVAAESVSPLPRREFPSSYLDLGPSRLQSSARLITNKEIFQIITTPNTPYANLIANLNRKRQIIHRSLSAPSVFTGIKDDFHDPIDPRTIRGSSDFLHWGYFVCGHWCFGVLGKWEFQRHHHIQASGCCLLHNGCIAVGTISAHFLEDLDWVNSFYLSVTSVTTVGYGDYAFTTVTGRCFAIIWLLKKITISDLVSADLDNDGSISKAEFAIYKLKEMGKITDLDIQQLSRQFDSMDTRKCGKLTLADIMEPV